MTGSPVIAFAPGEIICLNLLVEASIVPVPRDRRVVFGGLLVSTGRYYRGELQTLVPSLVLRPTHHASFTSSWEWSWLHDIDGSPRHRLLSVLNAEVRIALDPYVQATLFHRRDRGAGLSATTLRISWEYRPLSFLYVLFSDYAGESDSSSVTQITVKLSYVYQI